MKKTLIALLMITTTAALADNLTQLYEKAYFLETAKGQTEQALEIYREIAATKATDENQETICRALGRMQSLYGNTERSPLQDIVDNCTRW